MTSEQYRFDCNCISVTAPLVGQHWFAVVEHNKGTAVWLIVASTAADARSIARTKAQSLYSGLDWDMTINLVAVGVNAITAAHEVRFDKEAE